MGSPRFKLKGRLIFLVSLLFMLGIVLLNLHMAFKFLNFSSLLVNEKLTSNINSLNVRMEENRNNTRTAAISMATNPEAIKHIREKNREELINLFRSTFDLFRINNFTITDNEGIVIARTHYPDLYGDSVINQQNFRDALAGKTSTYFEEGTYARVSVRTGAPVYDTDGTLIGAISAIVRYDTEDTVNTLSGLLKTDVTVFHGNKRIFSTIMQDDESVVGTTLDPDIAKIVIDQKQEFFGEVVAFGRTYQTYYKPLINANNETFAIIFLGIDINDLKAESLFLFIEAIIIGIMAISIAIILLYALKDAMLANTAKSAFLSTMSHEIRTPMNAILGITEIQLQNKKLDEGIKDALEKIYVSGDMLLGIINDILDLSKIEAGKFELVKINYEIASLICDTAQLNMMRIGSKPLKFELFVDENIPSMVYGDELRIKQILNNIISNSIKYSSQGTVSMSVSAKQGTGENDIILGFVIKDTGQGMTQEQINRLFDEYSRFNMAANRTTEGTGLGMSITRNLIKLMDGDISVESEFGKGSTFTVTIPQIKIGNELLGKEKVENLLKFKTESIAQMKRAQIIRDPMPYGSVLIVDDVEMNIYVAKGLLTPYGLKIDSANSGFDALEKIEHGNVYDIVFMDHMMPEMDGIETTKKIRQLGYNEPIVALTANAVAGQADVFLSSGFDDFISKPIDIRQMNEILNKYIRNKQPKEVIEKARQLAAKNTANLELTDENTEAIPAIYTEIFAKDASKSVAVLESLDFKKPDSLREEKLRLFVIHVHGMKSALAHLGEMDLSATAMQLEAAGRSLSTSSKDDVFREKYFQILLSETPSFIESLKKLVEKHTPKETDENIELTDEDKKLLHEKLQELNSACSNYDESAAEEAISVLKSKKWPLDIKELLNSISQHLLHSDFEEIQLIIENYLKENV